jgi:hypothetical protein
MGFAALNPCYAMPVIASQRVRAPRGPMTGSAKQSKRPLKMRKALRFVRSGLLGPASQSSR